jgi:SAM-dependent methyltransferase
MKVKDHYKNHLHSYYSWIYGGHESKTSENLDFFNDHGIKPNSNGLALDLGCGSGFQSIPLADIGFEVKAIDFCGELLRELKEKSGARNISVIEADMTDFKRYAQFEPELVVCMGDTITHLDSLASVNSLLGNCHEILRRDGRLVLTFRDLTFELKDEKRFIPVQNGDGRIFTCFLEYFPDHVKVFDLVNEKDAGGWSQKIIWYNKLRISGDRIRSILSGAGFTNEFFNSQNGMITVICKK